MLVMFISIQDKKVKTIWSEKSVSRQCTFPQAFLRGTSGDDHKQTAKFTLIAETKMTNIWSCAN